MQETLDGPRKGTGEPILRMGFSEGTQPEMEYVPGSHWLRASLCDGFTSIFDLFVS